MKLAYFKVVHWLQAIVYTIIVGVVSWFYLLVVMKDVKIAIPLTVLTILVYLFSIYYKQKIKIESEILKELQLYALTMIYYLERGNNVLNALVKTRESIKNKQVLDDIDETIFHLGASKPELVTEHFRKYKYEALDIFHHLLKIKYEKGGDSREIFKSTNKYINLEIEKREKLIGKMKTVKTILLVMVYMALVIPLIFGLRAESFYDMFMNAGFIANAINITYYVLLMISLFLIYRSSSKLNLSRY